MSLDFSECRDSADLGQDYLSDSRKVSAKGAQNPEFRKLSPVTHRVLAFSCRRVMETLFFFRIVYGRPFTMKSRVWTGTVAAAAMALSACGGESPSKSSSGDEVYEPQNLPGVYSLDLPQSLTAGAEGGSSSRLGRLKSRSARNSVRSALSVGTGDYTQAQGYSELTSLVDMMNLQKSTITMSFLQADVVYDDVLSQCNGVSGVCTIPAGTLSVKVTQKIVNYIIESMGGEEMLSAGDLAGLDSMVGETIPVPEVRFQVLLGEGGYDLSISFVEVEGYVSTLKWNLDRTRVNIHFEYSNPEWGSGFDSFTYDDTEKLMTYRNEFSYEGNTTRYTATIGSDSDKSSLNGIKFSVGVDVGGYGGAYGMSIAGVADDEGGFAESTYRYTEVQITVSSGANNVIPGENYAFVNASKNCAVLEWQDIWGGVYGDGTNAYAYYHGPVAGASNTKICSYSFDEEFNLIGGSELMGVGYYSGTPQDQVYYYREVFDGSGALVKAGYKSDSNDPYTYYEGAAVSSEYEAYYYEEQASGEFIQGIAISVTGMGSVSTESAVVIVRDGGTYDGEDWTDVIGYGWYNPDRGGFEFSYWGTAEEIATADVYQDGYGSGGNRVLGLVSGAAVIPN
jgi:hypothetical protein